MNDERLVDINKSKTFINFAYIYITLPFVIFVIGWIRWYYAIIILICVLGSLFKAMRNTDPLCIPTINQTNILKMVIIFAIIAGLMVDILF
jgi:hypothetical protein